MYTHSDVSFNDGKGINALILHFKHVQVKPTMATFWDTFQCSSPNQKPSAVYQDGGQGATRASVLYIGHVKEPRGLFETS